MAISGGNKNRQKMISLMYLVFIAMVALNVSSEILDGFDKVEESRTYHASWYRNSQQIYRTGSQYRLCQQPLQSKRGVQQK